jgi:hypothetical protein
MRRQVKKNIPVVLTTKVTEATLDGGSSGDFGPVGPAPLIDGGGSSENSLGGGDGAGLGKSEGTAGDAEGNTT